MNHTDANSPEPRPAATAVLMRPSDGGFEILITVRPKEMRFMAGATVFPGGAVDPADLDPRWAAASAIDAETAALRLGEGASRKEALGWFVCALREAYEEVGFLIGEGDLRAVPRTSDPVAFREACLDDGVVLATDLLVPAGRWITPLGAPVRFDARFFLCRVPEEFEPSPDPSEVAEVLWTTPARALVEMSSGSRLMAPPTVEMLQRLESFSSIEAAMEGLNERGVGGGGRILSARLSPRVHVVLAPNPGVMTGPGTNTYIVGSEPGIVIDPAVDDQGYIDAVLEAAGEVATILITHRHPDHVGGVAALVARTGAPVRAWGSEDAGGVPVVPLHDDEVIRAEGAALRTLHSPGHASDHVCFLLEGSAALFAGDNVLGEGTAVIAPPDGNMKDYLQTLERLAAIEPDRIFTGHFRPLDEGTEVIRGYIDHRKAREESILACIRGRSLEVEEIVSRVYTDVSSQLHAIARYSVLAHLELAESEGRVCRVDDRWMVTPGD